MGSFPAYGKTEVASVESMLSIDRSTSFVGRRGSPLDYAPYQRERNVATNVGNRRYSAHSLDRIQDRGYFPSVVENTINYGIKNKGKDIGTLRYYNPEENFSVIVNEKTGTVITVIPGGR